MTFIDIFNLLAGFASLASIAIVLHEKYKSWRKYTIPLTCLLSGFILGHISGGFSSTVSSAVQITPFSGWIIILVLVLLGFFWLSSTLINKKQTDRAMGILYWVLLLFIFLPSNIFLLSPTPEQSSLISSDDYLKLSRIKEDEGNISGAIHYLEIYKDGVSDTTVKKQVESKISILIQKQLQKELDIPTETLTDR